MKRLKIYCILLAIPCLALQCNKEKDKPEPDNNNNKEGLPPATQRGENTFGCLVNGEIWKPKSNEIRRNSLRASFGLGRLVISAERELNRKNIDNEFNITLNKRFSDTGYYKLMGYNKKSIKNINYAIFREEEIGCEYKTLDKSQNYILINRLDSIQNTVSGRFQFTAINDSCGDIDTIRVTKGRFDIKYAH